jgi:fructose-1,6-bisphosphatase/inositol monophosphatase family enzyme
MDTDAVLGLLKDVADEVIDPRFRSLSSGEVMEKNPGDLVTVADREAEVRITAALRAAYPGTLVLGEEAYAGDRGLLAAFRAAPHAFTVDPVDGTKNFVHGSRDHAVMVAEVRDGVSVRGWIWQPQHQRGFVAERGAGAYADGTRLRIPPAVPPWRGVTSRRAWLGRSLDGGAGPQPPLELTWVSCGIDYPHLAEGDATYVLYSGTMPWDHAPGSLLVTEAGGFVGTVDGEDYAPVRPARGIVAAASREVFDEVRRGFTAAGLPVKPRD